MYYLSVMDTTARNIFFDTAIVIGHGSIGKKHAEKLSILSKKLIIIDPLVQEYDYSTPTSQINSILFLHKSNSIDDLVVVSNWGPDHFETIEYVIKKGYKQIIIEKPMVCSLNELGDLVKLIKSNNIKIAVNQGWHYERLAERVNKIAESFSLGEVMAVWVNGGARCLSTAGSHYIHLAKSIFREAPTEINANLNFDNINPRSSRLIYIDGAAFIKFGRKMLSINYSNFSSIEGHVEILWKEAIGLLDGTHLVLKSLIKNRPYANTITRYAKPSVILFDDIIPQIDNLTHLNDESIYFSIKSMKYELLLQDFEQHLVSNKILLYCLVSNELKRTLQFSEDISEILYEKKFKIS